jgi:hypothetical protein
VIAPLPSNCTNQSWSQEAPCRAGRLGFQCGANRCIMPRFCSKVWPTSELQISGYQPATCRVSSTTESYQTRCWDELAKFASVLNVFNIHMNTCDVHFLPGQRVPVGRARTSRRVPPAGLRCAVSPGSRLRLLRPVSRPVCGFAVSGSASLRVAWPCCVACSCVCT